MTQDINQLQSLLKSNDPLEKIQGLDQSMIFLDSFFDTLIATLSISDDKLFVSERIYAINNIIDKKLLHIHDNSSDNELRFFSTLILFSKRPGFLEELKNELLAVLEGENWEWISLSILKLSQAKIAEATPFIIKLLRKIDSGEIDKVTMLLNALKNIQGELPEELYEKFSGENSPWQIKAALVELKNK